MVREWMAGWGALILSIIFNVFGVFIIKKELSRAGAFEYSLAGVRHYFNHFISAPQALIAVFIFFLAPFLFAAALSRIPLTLAYPVQIGLNFLFLLVLSVFLLGERLTVMQSAGTFLILAGVYLLTR